MKIKLHNIIPVIKAKVLQGDTNHHCLGAAVDSRKIQGGELFFAFPGENTDGHNFLAKAFEAGALAAIVEKAVLFPEAPNFPILQVLYAKVALQECAKLARIQFTGRVIAVTGSNGKTTTKDMIAKVLAGKYLTQKTYANFNNEIGLPLTILNTSEEAEALVLEMGMRAQGEIALLASIAQPHIGVITNIGISHMELLKSQENIARAKFELIDALPSDGTAILNADDPWCMTCASIKCKIVTYGLGAKADLRGENLRICKEGTYFVVYFDNDAYEAFLPTWGRHNVANALAALAVAVTFGMSITTAIEGLKQYEPSAMRLEIKKSNLGCTIIDDAYNANPISAAASLEVLRSITSQRTVAVLGEMYELGTFEEEGHENVGASVVENAVDILVTVGEKAESIAKGAKSKGMSVINIHSFKSNDSAGSFLKEFLLPEDTVLIKGSRGMHMERIINILIKGE